MAVNPASATMLKMSFDFMRVIGSGQVASANGAKAILKRHFTVTLSGEPRLKKIELHHRNHDISTVR